jgi:hypothetical protein
LASETAKSPSSRLPPVADAAGGFLVQITIGRGLHSVRWQFNAIRKLRRVGACVKKFIIEVNPQDEYEAITFYILF